MFHVIQVEISLFRDGLQQKFQLVLMLRVDDGVAIVPSEELCQMLGHLLEDGFRMQVDKLLPADGVHAVDVARVRPVAVVYRGKGDPFVMTVNRSEHHVSCIQRVDKVGWERVALLHQVGYRCPLANGDPLHS